MDNNGGVNVGTATVLIIFLVLCLAVFSTLSFVSAYSDYKISEKNVSSIGAYYSADAQAMKKIAQIDGALEPILLGLYASSAANPMPAAYYNAAEQALAKIDGVSVTAGPGGNPRAAFSIPLDDYRTLSVVLSITGSGPGDRYRITSFKVVSNDNVQ